MSKQPVAPKRILILDDDPDIVRVLKIVLEGEGYSVDAHTEAAKALEALRGERIDLFILDEDTKGLKLAEFVTEAGQVPGLDAPLLVLCASEEKTVKAFTGFAGAADFLAKPLSRGDLVDRVRMLLGQERSYWRLQGIGHE